MQRVKDNIKIFKLKIQLNYLLKIVYILIEFYVLIFNN